MNILWEGLMLPKMSRHRKLLHVLLGLIVMSTMLLVACGDDAEPAPAPAAKSAAKAKATATPTSPPAAAAKSAEKPAAKSAAKPKAQPKPKAAAPAAKSKAADAPKEKPKMSPRRPTATPLPAAATKVEAAQIPLDSRLKVAMVPPGNQVTMMWQTLQSGTGPLKPMYEMLIGQDTFTGDWNDQGLATDWSMEPGAKAWNFNLRQGIPFHSTDSWTGTEFTTADIPGTIETLVREDSPGTAAVWTNRGAQKPENFEIHDDYSFTWKLDAAEPLWEGYAASGWVAGMLSHEYMNAVGLDGYSDHPIGTGPYKFVNLEVDQGILYERVEDHWRKTPEFSELVFLYVKEDSTRLAMQLAEESHISDIPTVLIPETTARGHTVSIGTLPGYYLYIWIGGLYYGKPMEIRVGDKKGQIREVAPGYTADDPLRNVLVRKALNLSVDRQLLNDTFWGGNAIPELIHNFPPTHPDFKHDDWTPYPYDPEEAKRLLAEAGYPEGFEFDFQTSVVSGVPEAPEVAEAVTAMWQDIGLKPNLQPIQYSTMRKEMRARDVGRTVGTFRQGAGQGGIYTRGGLQYRIGPVAGGVGNGLWELEELDDLWLPLSQAIDPDEILQRTYDIGDYMYENYIVVPLFFLFPNAVVNPKYVAEYRQNMLHFGPTVGHEYTKPVYR